MPKFCDIYEEMHRLAMEWGHPTIAAHIEAGRHPGAEHRTIFDALVDRATKNLEAQEKEQEWAILQLTKP